ncbi:MAG: metal ABC transporter ATP-binding protein [Candidatus Puniceispirillales bacterium]
MKKNKPLVKLNNAGVYRDEKWLVKGVSLEINKQEIVTLIGPNGSGKTTTGKLILDILKPDEGSVTLNTKKISYIPQKINIDWAIPLRVIDFMNITSKLNKSKIVESLGLTGVDHLIHKNLLNLSGGEFQRVMIARAIAKKPELLILDEPVQGVDFNGEIKLYNLIKEISDKLKCGILLISHDIHFRYVINRPRYLPKWTCLLLWDTKRRSKKSSVYRTVWRNCSFSNLIIQA